VLRRDGRGAGELHDEPGWRTLGAGRRCVARVHGVQSSEQQRAAPHSAAGAPAKLGRLFRVARVNSAARAMGSVPPWMRFWELSKLGIASWAVASVAGYYLCESRPFHPRALHRHSDRSRCVRCVLRRSSA